MPEGTWALFLASLIVLVASPRSRASWFDEATVLALPVLVILVMSVLTNINLGLRYVLPSFPFVFISMGKLVPWATGIANTVRRRAAETFLGVSLAATCDRDAFDRASLPGLFQLGLGGSLERLVAPDRQQHRLGSGPRRVETLAPNPCPQRTRGPGLLRSDQPQHLPVPERGGISLVSASSSTGNDRR